MVKRINGFDRRLSVKHCDKGLNLQKTLHLTIYYYYCQLGAWYDQIISEISSFQCTMIFD